jgi:geranylgeranyl transferase type-2 subunit alpha
MHGRKRLDQELSEADIAADKTKAATYVKLVAAILSRRDAGDFSAESLELTSKVLKSNPELYSLWNFRRNILIKLYGDIGLGAQDVRVPLQLANNFLSAEHQITVDAIQKNSKSYCAWYHRQWLVDHIEIDIDSELELCKEFLEADQRNFHCWNYRRYLVDKFHISNQSEIEYSTLKIQENFSNYSAFHHRSVYILNAMTVSPPECILRDIMDNEFSIIENAIFTEPDDQSAWWYYHFLLKCVNRTIASGQEYGWVLESLGAQLTTLNSLLEVEPNNKWTMLALISLMDCLIVAGVGQDSVMQYKSDIHRFLSVLCDLDTCHERRYKSLMDKYSQ